MNDNPSNPHSHPFPAWNAPVRLNYGTFQGNSQPCVMKRLDYHALKCLNSLSRRTMSMPISARLFNCQVDGCKAKSSVNCVFHVLWCSDVHICSLHIFICFATCHDIRVPTYTFTSSGCTYKNLLHTETPRPGVETQPLLLKAGEKISTDLQQQKYALVIYHGELENHKSPFGN